MQAPTLLFPLLTPVLLMGLLMGSTPDDALEAPKPSPTLNDPVDSNKMTQHPQVINVANPNAPSKYNNTGLVNNFGLPTGSVTPSNWATCNEALDDFFDEVSNR